MQPTGKQTFHTAFFYTVFISESCTWWLRTDPNKQHRLEKKEIKMQHGAEKKLWNPKHQKVLATIFSILFALVCWVDLALLHHWAAPLEFCQKGQGPATSQVSQDSSFPVIENKLHAKAPETMSGKNLKWSWALKELAAPVDLLLSFAKASKVSCEHWIHLLRCHSHLPEEARSAACQNTKTITIKNPMFYFKKKKVYDLELSKKTTAYNIQHWGWHVTFFQLHHTEEPRITLQKSANLFVWLSSGPFKSVTIKAPLPTPDLVHTNGANSLPRFHAHLKFAASLRAKWKEWLKHESWIWGKLEIKSAKCKNNKIPTNKSQKLTCFKSQKTKNWRASCQGIPT